MNKNLDEIFSDQPSGKTIRSLLYTRGFLVIEDILTTQICLQLSKDIDKLTSEKSVSTNNKNNLITNGLLNNSDAAIELLDNKKIGLLVKEAFNADAILNQAEGVRIFVNEDFWRNDFVKHLNNLQPRSFRPGINIYFPLDDTDYNVEIIPSTQYFDVNGLADSIKPISQNISRGSALLLEGRIKHRFRSLANNWLKLTFIRPWMKPDIWFATALSKIRLDRLNSQGQQWCGLHIGLPSTVEEFLSIENAALGSDHGRVKGSGI